ncbi:glycosyltransferase [Aromatoleum petrolei]|uniref:Glycosyltransferase n=1 Tax=Aromatoleum petrolei TaxID=76116 RepID=A0ABX1MHE6_9RHOO|nr:glycosyltransferase [Aromatoleum petrolei]NMF87367.1 glycosyltransferase [Aromatoleum petrolei]QTQ35734.1 Glycosyl transferase, family 2 [Aromatoleum petrolei]
MKPDRATATAAPRTDGGVETLDTSVIVCTFNRAASLHDTLQALHGLRVSQSRQWEVVVVDNNSNDDTRRVVETMQRDWPLLRYEFEPLQGLSHARNRGIASARGDVLLFTDDDVLPEPDWLEATLDGLERHRVDACGGYVAPIWGAPPPPWLTERFHGFLAIRAERSDEYPITRAADAPFGANMAVRRSVFERVGGFDTGRGRKGAVLAAGEDGELFARILEAGFKVVFLGQSRVHHKVEAFRLTKRYFRRWRLHNSRNQALHLGMPGNRRLFNIPLYLFPQFLRALGRAVAGRFTAKSDEAFNREIVVCHFLGVFQGLWQARHHRN